MTFLIERLLFGISFSDPIQKNDFRKLDYDKNYI